MVLVAGIAAAMIWANASDASCESFWHAKLSIGAGPFGISQDLRTWLNSGLMTLFFLVVGLETRREFDLGDLRERRRFVLPLVAGLAGMAVPIAIYLSINAGRPSAHGWGVAMSTDTALALGLLAVLGRDVPDRMRVFVLTVFVVDDLVALAVIAGFYSGSGTIAGIGFTVALLIATRAFQGEELAEAKLGALSAAFVAAMATWAVLSVTRLRSADAHHRDPDRARPAGDGPAPLPRPPGLTRTQSPARPGGLPTPT